jgi:hypothetical protein
MNAIHTLDMIYESGIEFLLYCIHFPRDYHIENILNEEYEYISKCTPQFIQRATCTHFDANKLNSFGSLCYVLHISNAWRNLEISTHYLIHILSENIKLKNNDYFVDCILCALSRTTTIYQQDAIILFNIVHDLAIQELHNVPSWNAHLYTVWRNLFKLNSDYYNILLNNVQLCSLFLNGMMQKARTTCIPYEGLKKISEYTTDTYCLHIILPVFNHTIFYNHIKIHHWDFIPDTFQPVLKFIKVCFLNKKIICQ